MRSSARFRVEFSLTSDHHWGYPSGITNVEKPTVHPIKSAASNDINNKAIGKSQKQDKNAIVTISNASLDMM